MLSAFQLENNRLTCLEVDGIGYLVSSVWVDLVEPNNEEWNHMRKNLGQNLITRPELEGIEMSTHFFEDEDGLHIHSFFLYGGISGHVGNSTVTFIIREGRLFTLRGHELPVFRLYRMRARNQVMVNGNAYELLLGLLEAKAEQLADEIEDVYGDLEKPSHVVTGGCQDDGYDETLSTLTKLEDIGWEVRPYLMNTQRALNLLVHKTRLPGSQLEQTREILRDIESLPPRNKSLLRRVNFLMQAAMGFTNIEQDCIIRTFLVISMIFLSPTLVASSYGMNFKFMSELHQSFGYPGAIVFMMLMGLASYLCFKRKSWL